MYDSLWRVELLQILTTKTNMTKRFLVSLKPSMWLARFIRGLYTIPYHYSIGSKLFIMFLSSSGIKTILIKFEILNVHNVLKRFLFCFIHSC